MKRKNKQNNPALLLINTEVWCAAYSLRGGKVCSRTETQPTLHIMLLETDKNSKNPELLIYTEVWCAAYSLRDEEVCIRNAYHVIRNGQK
jgi:hypothetical protein